MKGPWKVVNVNGVFGQLPGVARRIDDSLPDDGNLEFAVGEDGEPAIWLISAGAYKRAEILNRMEDVNSLQNYQEGESVSPDPEKAEALLEEFNAVNLPALYTAGGVECIEAIEAAVTPLKGKEAFLTGQIIKYMWRWKMKNGLEDLKKANFYLQRLIKSQEGQNEKT